MKTWLMLFGICIVLVSAFPASAGELAPVSYVYDGQGAGSQPSRSPAFPDPEKKKLIDGALPQNSDFKDPAWVGFMDKSGDVNISHPQITFKLGAVEKVSRIQITYLHSTSQAAGGITAPEEVRLSVSTDGTTFSQPVTFTPGNHTAGNEIRTATVDLKEDEWRGQYVRLDIRNASQWTFLGEVKFFTGTAGEASPSSAATVSAPPKSAADNLKAASDKNVVFIGDSITCGVGVGVDTPALRFSTRVIEGFKAKGQIATEINLGKSGQALCDQGVGYPSGVLLQKPSIVIVQWGVNDHYWGYSVPQFIIAYDRLVSTLRKANPELQIVLCTLISDFRYPDSSEHWICEANIAIQELAVNYRCHLADLHKALSHDKAKYYSDTIHPNQAGAQAIADEILRALSEPVLSESNQRFSSDLTNGEIRFLQNVFTFGKGESGDDWIEVSDITKNGMKIKASAPLAVRTTLQGYQKGTYRVGIKDPSGMVTDTQTLNITRKTVLKFLVKPVEKNQTTTVSICEKRE